MKRTQNRSSVRPFLEFETNHIGASYLLALRPLNVKEVQRVVEQARTTGWIDSLDVIQLVAKLGIEPDAEPLLLKDSVLQVKVAHEVWHQTLKAIDADTRRLFRLASTKPPKPYRRTSWRTRLTPGLAYAISKRLDRFNSKKLSDAVLSMFIAGGAQGAEHFKGERLRLLVQDNKLELMSDFFRIIGISKDLYSGVGIFPWTDPERHFLAAWMLLHTLEWPSYYSVLFKRNAATELLAREVNNLGGVPVKERDGPFLTSALPPYPKVLGLSPLNSIELVGSFLKDAVEQSAIPPVSPRIHARARKAANNAFHKFNNMKENGPEAEKICAVLNSFIDSLPRSGPWHLKLTARYWDEYQKYVLRYLETEARDMVSQIRSMTPDLYVLVEGPSDRVIMEHAVELLRKNEEPVIAKFIECGGESKILNRLRQIVSEQHYTGGVVCLFDSDAASSHKEAAKFCEGNPDLKPFILSEGAIEDQFSWSLHRKAMKSAYNCTLPVSDPNLDAPVVNTLSRICWNDRRASFNKVGYSRAITAHLNRAKQLPQEVQRVGKVIIEISRRKAEKFTPLRPATTRFPKAMKHLQKLVDAF